MSLITREPSPAQSNASRANSLCSTGPRTDRGKEVASRNSIKLRRFSAAAAHSMEALGEFPGDFDETYRALAAAMDPRDGWEAAWVQDIAILRWRLERLQRTEIASMAAQRRRLNGVRRRAASPATGSAGLELRNMVGMLGFTGIADCAVKFKEVLEYFNLIRELIQEQMFDEDINPYLALLFGKTPGPQAAMLKARYETLAKHWKEQHFDAVEECRKPLLADVDAEIQHYKKLEAAYKAEHLEADQVQQDAELLLPQADLANIIHYETHLEDQLERKLRQFYARRRETVLRMEESLPASVEEIPAGESACEAEPAR